MEELKNALMIETGLVDFTLNGSVTVRFNPTDAYFMERVLNTFEMLAKEQEKYETAVRSETDPHGIFDMMHETDATMRKSIAELFGMDVVTPLIGSANVYMLADGAPFWANLLEAIIDRMDAGFKAEKEASKKRILKYTDKYKNGSKYHK